MIYNTTVFGEIANKNGNLKLFVKYLFNVNPSSEKNERFFNY